ncbi:Thyrotropin-releasing hormone receptor [Halotydeus destructor]|nr:Thyrotropin-releasing hormone receptor [Halotydeus destructor]
MDDLVEEVLFLGRANGSSLSNGTSLNSFTDCQANDTSLFGNASSSLNWTNDNGDPLCPYNDNINWKDPSYYAVPYRIIGTIFQGFILLIGVLGNIMVVIVVMRTRSMKTPTNCYLVSLSIADLMVLVSAVPNEILSYYVLGEQWVWGQVGCGLFIFCQYLGINASSAQKVCTVHRAKNIITGVWIFSVIYCSPWLFLTKTEAVFYKGRTDIETCTFALSRQFYRGYFFADLLLFYVFPLILSCILYGLIARILFSDTISKSVSGKTHTSVAKSSKNGASGSGSGGRSSKRELPLEAKKSSSQSCDSARVQVVKMLVVVVAVFATLWLPYRALLVYNSFAKERYMELWFLMFCKTMIFVNSAINPILYNALSVKFRRAFKRMLCCDDAAAVQYRMRGTMTTVHHHHHPHQRDLAGRHNASILTTTYSNKNVDQGSTMEHVV